MSAPRYYVGRRGTHDITCIGEPLFDHREDATPERLVAAVEAMIASPPCASHNYWIATCRACNRDALLAALRVLAEEEK